ncbi:methyl-accepting chemotaxis protein [Nitrincola iocasae]|uniref:Methyl-accepting chemotaxis protein n=1 Tax=Nitrincola iocasae TaxID=2614693 RepID=A0A5J6LDD9_9GAMM|nr:methyl-accepting chemotaxis protein [Nitrincola iocasae]QEW06615.1 methyl-accepting chemotaxis protein [Nitrincola iocasae]
MNMKNQLGFRVKVALPFVIAALAMIVIVFFAVNTVRNLVSDTDRVAEVYLPSISEVLNGDRDLYQALVAQNNFVEVLGQGDEADEYLASYEENAQQAYNRFNQAVDRLQDTNVAEIVEGFKPAFDSWKASADRVLNLARNGNISEAQEIAKSQTRELFERLRNYFDDVGAYADEQAQIRATEASAEGQSSSITIIVVTVIALLMSSALFMFFLKLITHSISDIRGQLDNIAQGEGDLTQRIVVEQDDDIGKLAHSFNLVLDNLQSMIASIQQLTTELGGEATGLSRTAAENMDGVTRQTDSISMVATAINEMQSAIEEVAGNASRASEITREAEEKGQNGGRIIRQTSTQVQQLSAQIAKAVEVIRQLSEDSNNITSVLDVIRGIADQTNLLALNAAIEAARAGEQGRGFAVVADEVRTLAQRTQTSTEDIQKMICALQTGVSNIVSVMETGSDQASQTEELALSAETEIQGILEAMANIADMNVSVASATEEQTQVVEEINQNITRINDLAGESAEHSRAIDGISNSLEGYARKLEDQTGKFKV